MNDKTKRIAIIFCTFILLSFSLCYADDTPTEEIYTDPTTMVLRISSTDTTGFHAIMLGFIGDYNPIVKDYTYTNQQGYIQHSIDIEPDWSWIASCATFCLVFFCFMQFIGKLFNR